MKKIMGLSTLALAGVLAVTGCSKGMTEAEALKYAEEQGYVKVTGAALPAPTDVTKTTTKNGQEVSCDSEDETIRYSLACSAINYTNLKEHLGRKDVFYVDVRDSNTYEDSTTFNTGDYSGLHLKGFSNVEFFAYVHGNKNQLFYTEADGTFAPRYATSVETLEALFPKDKTLFIMCQSGGRVVTLMRLLSQYGWDMSKVYNIGGMQDYTEARGYADYRLEATDEYQYAVLEGTKTGTVEGYDLDVTVNVLYDAGTETVKGVYLHSNSVFSSPSYKEAVEAELADLKAQIVGKTADEVLALMDGNNLSGDLDAITQATATTKVIVGAVINALETL